MALNFRFPKPIELYREIAGNQGFLTQIWMEAAAGTIVEMAGSSILKLNGQEVLAFKVSYQENIFYILAEDVDANTERLCGRWAAMHRRRNPLAVDMKNVIEEAVRKYTRASLLLVRA